MAGYLEDSNQLSALPQAPNIGDPRNYSLSFMQAAQSAHAGLALGNELANLDNIQAQRDLEAQKIKAAKAQNDLDQAYIDHAKQTLPQLLSGVDASVAAKTAADTTSAASSNYALAGINAMTKQDIPASTAMLTNVQLGNQIDHAAADSAFSRLSTPQQANATGVAGALAQYGLTYTGTASDGPALLGNFGQRLGIGLQMDAAKQQQSEGIAAGINPQDPLYNGPDGFDRAAYNRDVSAYTQNVQNQKNGISIGPEQRVALVKSAASASAFNQALNARQDAEANNPYATGVVGGRVAGVLSKMGYDPGTSKQLATAQASLLDIAQNLTDAKIIRPNTLKTVSDLVPDSFNQSPEQYADKINGIRERVLKEVQDSYAADSLDPRRLTKQDKALYQNIINQLTPPTQLRETPRGVRASLAGQKNVQSAPASNIIYYNGAPYRKNPDGSATRIQ